MVGHERFCSLEQGCKPCPICNGTVRIGRHAPQLLDWLAHWQKGTFCPGLC